MKADRRLPLRYETLSSRYRPSWCLSPRARALYWLLRASVRERNPLSFHHPPLSFCQVVLSHRSRRGEWFLCTRENRRVGAADHQGRHAKAALVLYQRPLQTQRDELHGPLPAGVFSHTWARFRLPSDSHGAAHPRLEERSPCSLHPERQEPICAVQGSVAPSLDAVVPG